MDASRHTHSDSKEKGMSVDPRAGKLPGPPMLANIPRLMTAYYTRRPDPSVREQRVAFGTVYKLCAESFKGRDHLTRIQAEAQAVVQKAYQAGAAG